MQLSNKMYDVLKWVAQILLPAIAVLYLAMSKVWGLPYGNEVVATVTAIDLFLGSLLGVSNAMYLKAIADDGNLYKFMMTLTDDELGRVKQLVDLKEQKIQEQQTRNKIR